MKRVTGSTCAILAAAWFGPAPGLAPSAAPGACGALASLSLPNVTITLAQSNEAGPFSPAVRGATAAAPDTTRSIPIPRAFCRVAATLTPSKDSHIQIEVWMPSTGWNQKLQAVGNGAFNGTVAYPAMATALARGYATASTDTGHTGNTASFGLGHPEKVVDFGWRAVHEMTVAAKGIVTAHYSQAPRWSYWNGCSAGGRQGLKEVQRFPADFDGVIAGAPGLDWTGRAAQAMRIATALERAPASRLSQPHRELLHGAVVDACDARDGLKDGLISEPNRCAFDPGTLLCKGAETTCLSAGQVDTARLIYSDGVAARGDRRTAGLAPGSELGWSDLGWTASARATGLEQFRFLVFGDPAWSALAFDFPSALEQADAADRDTLNALDPNIKAFLDRGGKLLQYHGWSDPQISPGNSVHYYERVAEALGGRDRISSSYRLFMAPGMGHCGGGDGPNTFDAVAALERWVERGQAPDQIVASHVNGGKVDRTRPLCPYPQVAMYRGTGSIDEATSFMCRVP
jgi:feruloyl esterase